MKQTLLFIILLISSYLYGQTYSDFIGYQVYDIIDYSHHFQSCDSLIKGGYKVSINFESNGVLLGENAKTFNLQSYYLELFDDSYVKIISTEASNAYFKIKLKRRENFTRSCFQVSNLTSIKDDDDDAIDVTTKTTVTFFFQ